MPFRDAYLCTMISSFDPTYLQSLKKKSKQKIAFLAILRLLSFILLITFLILAFAEHPLYIFAVLATSFGFVYLIKLFNSEQDLQSLIRALLQMQEERILRAARDLSSLDAGEEFSDKEHPFASDLDLFGKHSLFQLLNHTVTNGARQLLADRLRMQQPNSDSLSIQQAIPELSQKSDFLQLFEGLGKAHHQDARDFQLFEKWLGKNGPWKAFYWLPMVLGPLGGVAVLLAAVFGWMPAALVGLWILLGVVMMGVSHSYLKEVAELLPSFSQTKMYRLWAEQLQKEQFVNPYLSDLSQEYRTKKHPVSKGLYSLEQLTFLIQNRFNLMYIVLNAFFWLDFILVRRIYNWKQVFASGLGGLRENLDRWQLLVSYAIFVNEEGLTCFPTWINESSLQVTQLKHPLIGKDVAVGNDFSMEASTRTILLTGANMSGKTTFMRTIGINLVLANQGLPVFASSFQTYPFQLFTSMRNSDSLGESVSSFYAELARIKKILAESEEAEPVFFLMDEILKGTNTTDRIMGSEALIEQLAATSAKGIISTHDIELSALEEKHAYLKNFSFHSDIQDDSIHFDYTIKTGPCPAFNAKKLMQLMGIRL